MRVFVQPEAHYRPRPLRAVLRIAHGDYVERFSDERRLTARSLDAQRDSTFEIAVPGAHVTADAKVSVTLEEGDCVISREAAPIRVASHPASKGIRV